MIKQIPVDYIACDQCGKTICRKDDEFQLSEQRTCTLCGCVICGDCSAIIGFSHVKSMGGYRQVAMCRSHLPPQTFEVRT